MKRLVLSILAAALMAAPAFSDTLSFDGSDCSANSSGVGALVACVNYAYINQSYGDSATVDVTYMDLINSGNSLRWWSSGYNDLEGILWGGKSSNAGKSLNRIELVPAAGNTVTLYSFDLGAYYLSTIDTNLKIRELGTNLILIDYGVTSIGNDSMHSSFTPGVSSTLGIAIEWGDTGFDVGIDNIDFSTQASNDTFSANTVQTAVPEPSSLILSAIGVSAVLLKKRKLG